MYRCNTIQLDNCTIDALNLNNMIYLGMRKFNAKQWEMRYCYFRAQLWYNSVYEFFWSHQITDKSYELSCNSQLHVHHLGK